MSYCPPCESTGRFVDDESTEPIGFGETMAMVRGRFPTIRDMLNVRNMPNTNRDAKLLLDCTIMYHCYLRLGRPDSIMLRVRQMWAELTDHAGRVRV